MRATRPLVSIILVTYKEDKELFLCLVSLLHPTYRQAETVTQEIIVVDNNAEGRIQPLLRKKFPSVRYINSGADIGYGAGNNLGAKQASGKYLFFVNPDTEIEAGMVSKLSRFLEKNNKAGVVAPTLLDMQGNVYPDQGSAELTPLTGIASHSIIHRLWPSNRVAQSYWLRGRDMTVPQQLAVVPGTAFMIRSKVFNKLGGFDERFFLYFEESDLCRRVRAAGWEIWQIPDARLKHIWHAATQGAIYNVYFRQSRYKYFEKWYGPVMAGLTELVLNFGKKEAVVVLAVLGLLIWLIIP